MRDTNELKRQFAAELIRNDGQPFKAAFAVAGEDSGYALQIARVWAADPFVVAEQERLLNSKEASSFLPSKQQQARDIYALATDISKEPEDRLKAHKLYAEIMGYIEKPLAGAGINVLNQGVMIVPMAASDMDWQQKAERQQRLLTTNAIVN